MYSYKAYDLIFFSELALPELEPAEGAADVTIRIGTVPHDLYGAAEKGCFFQASKDEFLFCIDKCAGYYVRNGNEITIEPYVAITTPDIRLYLLGSVFGALLQQRGYLVLHGAAVVINGKGTLLTGRSGIGKSTLAAALQKKGYEVLTDDVCAVRLGDDGTPYIAHGFHSLKLWQDAAERLDTSIDGLEPVMSNREKYRVEFRNYHNSDAISLREVYILDVQDKQGIEIEAVLGMPKLDALIRNTYRYHYLSTQGMKTLHFQQCAAVANKIKVFHVLRPADGFMLNELSRAIEGNIYADFL